MARILKGTVSAVNNDKTITVTVNTAKTHPLYKKRYSVNKKFYAHDENNDANVGDVVEISEVPPISKTKRWNLSNIVEKSVGQAVTGEEDDTTGK